MTRKQSRKRERAGNSQASSVLVMSASSAPLMLLLVLLQQQPQETGSFLILPSRSVVTDMRLFQKNHHQFPSWMRHQRANPRQQQQPGRRHEGTRISRVLDPATVYFPSSSSSSSSQLSLYSNDTSSSSEYASQEFDSSSFDRIYPTSGSSSSSHHHHHSHNKNFTHTTNTTSVHDTSSHIGRSNKKVKKKLSKSKDQTWGVLSGFSDWSKSALQKNHPHYSNSMMVPPSSPPVITTPSPLLITSDLDPNRTLTVQDLEYILRSNGYVRQEDLTSQGTGGVVGNSRLLNKALATPVDPTDPKLLKQQEGSQKKTKSGVAFPQPSVLNYRDLQKGTTVAGMMVGMFVATTLLPNLWLMGLLAGGVYGHEISARVADPTQLSPTNSLAKGLVQLGRKLAQVYLQVYDWWQALWFLYKTGQLSYEYYKSYAVLDERFRIQDKMDAWNARFVEGKQKFDAWEQEHEVGRKVLASLRTVWLLDEQNRRKRQSRSKYRIIQAYYDLRRWISKSIKKVMGMAGIQDGRIQEFLSGIKEDWKSSELDAWGTRFGAVISALITANLVGALFAISPSFLALLATGFGLVFPTWTAELIERIQLLAQETRARGRGEDFVLANTVSSINTARLLGRYDKSKYHYYRREDGSKRFYRTGQPTWIAQIFSNGGTKTEEAAPPLLLRPQQYIKKPKMPTTSNARRWPWKTQQISDAKRQPGKEQWGLFGNNF